LQEKEISHFVRNDKTFLLFFFFGEDSTKDDMVSVMNLFDVVIRVFPEIRVVENRDEVECENRRS